MNEWERERVADLLGLGRPVSLMCPEAPLPGPVPPMVWLPKTRTAGEFPDMRDVPGW